MESGRRRIRIAVDAMGGDHGPEVVVQGAIEAARDMGNTIEIILVGDESQIWKALKSAGSGPLPIFVVHARESVAMGEKAKSAFRHKPESSIAICANLVNEGRADALFSAGNTGAVVTTSLLSMGRIRGVKRPAIASNIPTSEGYCVLLDVGANADCKPMHLFQFAQMGRIYAQLVLGIENPRVGLLNIGEERSKGNALSQATHEKLSESAESLNFIGNVEGQDIFVGGADVVVCDGFTGNVILKVTGSLASVGTQLIIREIRQRTMAKVGALMMKPALRGIKKKVNYEEVGGALLLGTKGICVIGHGKSTARAIRNGIDVAARSVRSDLAQEILQVINPSEGPATVQAIT
jgi:phosphate acyltransferase